MVTMAEIQAMFQAETIGGYDFSGSPELVTCARSAEAVLRDAGEVDAAQWNKVQEGFLERARHKEMYPLKHLEQVREKDGAFFAARGPLRGSVLDIGGGWGLYREWWAPEASSLFVVHDPGVERHVRGPYTTNRQCYEKAFAKPMTFVEGLGEVMPYKNDTFDTALITATLDHCADPARVLKESFRCLKPGGVMLVLQSCHEPRPIQTGVHLLGRVARLATSPRKLVQKVRKRMFGPPVHLHHFTVPGLIELFRAARFEQVTSRPVYRDVYALEGVKPPALSQ